MSKEKIFNKLMAIALCCAVITAVLPSNIFSPIESAKAEEDGEPAATRSNHDTQVKVLCPSNIRVNTWNGNLFYPISVLTIPGRGLSMGISMSYNSGWHNFTSRCGYGWQLSSNMFYIRDENGDIVIVRGDGSTDRYTNNDGTFLSPEDVYDTLREYEPGKYLLQNKYGTAFYFDSPIHKRVTRIQEPNDNALTFAYDSDMLLTNITDASGREVNFTYADDKLTSITDLQNRQIQFLYDANDNLISITDPLGNTMDYNYDSDHFMTSITDPRGDMTTITYSGGAVVNVTGELTNRSFSFDTENRITTMTDSTDDGDQNTRFFYDVDGRISTIEDPLGNSVSMTWDENNNLINFTDANGNMTTYTYDTMGNLLTVTDAENHTTTYTYDSAFNKLTSVTNANGHTTNYEYDVRGNLINLTDSLGQTTTYTYDGYGNLVSKTDANGFTTTYEYDEYGNVIGYLDNSFTYDNVGNAISMNNSNVNVTYTYDALNRVTEVNYVSFGKSIHYAYDEAGNRISMIDPDSGVTSYVYGKANRLINLTNHLGQTTTYTYDSIGRLIRKDYRNGVYTIYTYDEANRLLSLTNKNSSGGFLSSYTYGYDAAGNRISMTEANGNKTTYSYDNLYQLTRVTYPDNSAVNYTYDAFGNRLTLTNATEVTNYTYDATNGLLNAGELTYGWDNNGNLISKTDAVGTTIYTYDHDNRLVSITFPDGSTNNFTYYPDGRRLSKTNTSGKMIYYIYDGLNAILETNSAGTTIARYTSGLWIDDWISMDRGGLSYYYLYEGLGSVTGLTGPSEDLVAIYEYDAFGAIKSQTGSVVNPYKFTGREYDEESGLYYYRARYYEAEVGRFTSPDQIGVFFGQTNLYKYVNNNPTNYVDPLGLHVGLYQGTDVMGVGYQNNFVPVGSDNSQHSSPNAMSPANNANFISFFFTVGSSCGYASGIVAAVAAYIFIITGGGFTDLIMPAGYEVNSGFGSGDASKPLDLSSSAPLTYLQSNSLVTLDDIIPTEGPEGTAPVPSTPTLVESGITNAVNVVAMDFVDNETSQVKAVVFVTETLGETYEHDYSVCCKFRGYNLESVAPIALPGVLPGTTDAPWFWYVSATKGEFVEEAFIFTVFVDDAKASFTVDSRWLADYYPNPINATYDYVFNFRIWASSSEEAYKLLRKTLEKLSNYGTVSFANIVEPVHPTVLIKSAEYADEKIRMSVQSWLPETRPVLFFGTMRYTSGITDSIPFEYNATIEPGVNIVELPAENMHDAIVLTETDGFLDKVFISNRIYLLVDDFSDTEPKNYLGGNSSLFLNNASIALSYQEESLWLDYNVSFDNSYAGYMTMLNELDLTPYNSVTILVKGENGGEKAKIGLVDSSNNEHKILISEYLPEGITTQWQKVRIPFAAFTQVVNWSTMAKLDIAFENLLGSGIGTICIDDLRFEQIPAVPIVVDNFNAMTDENGLSGLYWAFADGEAVIDAAYDTENKYGDTGAGYRISYNVSETNYTFLSSDLMVLNALGYNTLSFYIRGADGGEKPNIYLGDGIVRNFVNVEDYAPVTTSWKKIDIPLEDFSLQGVNITDLRYMQVVFERQEMNGTIYLDDITITKARRNYLLVDDFSDIDPKNCLVGNSSLFYNNASIWLNYAEESLRLDYNVSSANSYAGYMTMLKEQDLTPYKSVTFLVKGENGGEKAKIGLVDSMNNEHKILISEYLPHGITTSWQKVRFPFAAFTQVVNRSSMAKLDISFENLLGSGIGTIYIDDLKFEQIPVVPIVVDNFNDMTGENGLGGLYWAFADGGAVIDAGYDIGNRHGDTGACYRITYNVTEANYTFLSSDFMVLNALGYNTLSFYIKGAKGGEKPNIYLFDGIERRFVVLEDYVPVTTFWQKVDIPLEDFIRQGIDISDLRYMQVVFEGAEMNGTVYLDDITITKARRNYLLVDDFSDTDTRNCLGGNSSVFYNNASTGLNYSTESLQLGYDVSLNNSYAGYITMLNQWDLTPYNTVTFLVNGENGGEKAIIGLVDSSNNGHKILISEYLPEGITTQWQEVRIPFAAFTQVINWYSMNKFDISFENLLGSGEGTIYIDELKFEQIPGVPIVVDNFNDMTGENGLGGLYWTFADGVAVIDAGYDSENRYGDFGAGYRISYSVTGTNYTFLSTDLTTLDAFGYNTLSFYIRGANGDEKPNVYLSDGIVSRFVNVEDYAPVTTSWQKIDIPLEDFIMQGVDITDLRYMQVVLEWEDMEGTIYLDDIQFYNPSPCFIATAAYGTALHDDINVLRDFRDE